MATMFTMQEAAEYLGSSALMLKKYYLDKSDEGPKFQVFKDKEGGKSPFPLYSKLELDKWISGKG